MSSLKEYQEVDSYWYDQVPSYWGKTKNKYVFCQNKHVVGENWEKLTLLTMGKSGVKPRDMDGGGKFPASFETYQTVEPNQLIFCLFDLDETPRTIGMSNHYGMITSAYDVFSTTEGNDPQFWTYFYQMIDDHKGLRPFYTGLRKVVRSDTFMGIEVFSPPLEEQKLISRYLDKKTEQIDSLVKKIQKKIELLKEQRTSLINQCVTKGLDPNVEMKDSGVEWIGEIPSHWDCKKLKYISKITYGISPQETTYNDEGIGTVLINGPVEYSITDFGYTRSIKWTTDPKNIVPKGSLLFCVRGSTTGRMNICHQDVSIGRGVCSIESKLDQDFTVFSMMIVRIYIQDQISGSTFPSVVKEDVDNFVLPCPPIEEQRLISKCITDEVEGIDKLINLHSKKNDTLREYRQSLISSVVTGKVRVTENKI